MSVNLEKGQRVDLTKGRPSLHKLLIGLGWDTNHYDGEVQYPCQESR
ncbi:TerD family protein [Mediterraneibacter gnavus]